jgi:hypothetical protein
VLVVAAAGHEQLVGDPGHPLGLARPQHLVAAVRRLGVLGVARVELVREGHHLRVGVADGQPVQAAVRAHEVERAPVGERGHREGRDLPERGLDVEGGRQHRAGLGEEAGAEGGRLGLAPRGLGRGQQPLALGRQLARVVHVGAAAEPARDRAGRVALRHRAREEPAVRAVGGAAEPVVALELLAARHRRPPRGQRGRAVVGVHHVHPPQPPRLLLPLARVVEPALVGEVGIAVGAAGPHELRHRLGQRVPAGLAVGQVPGRLGEGEVGLFERRRLRLEFDLRFLELLVGHLELHGLLLQRGAGGLELPRPPPRRGGPAVGTGAIRGVLHDQHEPGLAAGPREVPRLRHDGSPHVHPHRGAILPDEAQRLSELADLAGERAVHLRLARGPVVGVREGVRGWPPRPPRACSRRGGRTRRSRRPRGPRPTSRSRPRRAAPSRRAPTAGPRRS